MLCKHCDNQTLEFFDSCYRCKESWSRNPNTEADTIQALLNERETLLTAIAEIASQKLCKEMELPNDGDYRYAYEEMIRVARMASDAIIKLKE